MDAGLMRLALRNLLINAGKYAPQHTPVVLRVTDIDEPVGLVFAVVDQGPGIPQGLEASLFERGVRGHRDSAGHGLGLYVVRRVMELHGGTVDVATNPGGGAVFRLTLPQTDSHLVASPRAGRAESRTG
jgi:signal transduction histidine kinase